MAFARAAFVLALVVVAFWAFDRAYAGVRGVGSVAPDLLIYYNAILGWVHRSDSPLGNTLLPAPYFTDWIFEVPLAAVTRDFEHFAYGAALTYWLLLGAGLYVVLRSIAKLGRLSALCVVVGVDVLYPIIFPFDVVTHSFIQNHTSEVAEALFALGYFAPALLFHPSDRRSARRTLLCYFVFIFVCVASSGFFIAMFTVPFVAAVVVGLIRPTIDRRRSVLAVGVTICASCSGVFFDAVLATHLWPIRYDYYPATPIEALGRLGAAIRPFLGTPGPWLVVAALTTAAVLALRHQFSGRRTESPDEPAPFALTFFVAASLSCVAFPVLRGAFIGSYEFRYIQLPCFASLSLFVVLVVRGLEYALRRVPVRTVAWIRSPLVIVPSAIAAIAWAIWSIHGPLSIRSKHSQTSAMLACIADVEQKAPLADGIATNVVARYVNAAHFGTRNEQHVVVELIAWDPPSVHPAENNLAWFRGNSFRGGSTLNYLVTDRMSPDSIAYISSRVGSPDRIFTCPMAPDFASNPSRSFEIWVYDEKSAQNKLAKLVMDDPIRGVFAPPTSKDALDIDPEFGMILARDGDLQTARTRYLHLPSGRYRASAIVEPESADGTSVVELAAYIESRELARNASASSRRDLEVTFDIEGSKGPTSGKVFQLALFARGSAVRVRRMRIERLRRGRVDLLRLFR